MGAPLPEFNTNSVLASFVGGLSPLSLQLPLTRVPVKMHFMTSLVLQLTPSLQFKKTIYKIIFLSSSSMISTIGLNI
jgi:hypothetical protein